MKDSVTKLDLRRLNTNGKRFAYRIATLIRTARLHRMDNSAMDYSLKVASAAADQLVDDLGDVVLMGEGDTMHVNDFRLRFERSLIGQITHLNLFLHQRGVGGFLLSGSTEPNDWRSVITILNSARVLQEKVGIDVKVVDGSAKLNSSLGDLGVGTIRFAPVMYLRRGTLGGQYGGEGESVRVAASRSLQLYLRALRAVDSMQNKVGGKHMHLGVSRIVQYMVDQAFEDPRQHLALVNLKTGSSYRLRHPVHTMVLAVGLGQRLGMSRASLLDLGLSALTADLGMVELPEEIRKKGANLSREERDLIGRHPLDSASAILEGERFDLSVRRRLRCAFEHHLGADLGGYPSTLQWEGQHLFSRMFSVCETYDALTTSTPWREGLLPDEALAVMMKEAGLSLDPVLVTHLVNMLGRYPLGSILLLSTGEVCVVFSTPVESEHVLRPVVKLLLDAQGESVQESQIVDLRERDDVGRFLRNIVKTVDPVSLGLDVTRALYC
jgi:HD-GYP domain-containing protein (c-di-GMP phosphodiesterase class II)